MGSSSLLAQKGSTESLAGRFLSYRCGHWSWPEMREAFDWGLDETVLARDVLQMATVAKPALLPPVRAGGGPAVRS